MAVQIGRQYVSTVDSMTNSPRPAGLPDAEMELSEVTNRILLVLPVGPILLGAEPTREPVPHLLQEPVICLRKAEPTVVLRSAGLLRRQPAGERAGRRAIRERLGDPADGEVVASSSSGQRLQSHEVRLAGDCGLFSGLGRRRAGVPGGAFGPRAVVGRDPRVHADATVPDPCRNDEQEGSRP